MNNFYGNHSRWWWWRLIRVAVVLFYLLIQSHLKNKKCQHEPKYLSQFFFLTCNSAFNCPFSAFASPFAILRLCTSDCNLNISAFARSNSFETFFFFSGGLHRLCGTEKYGFPTAKKKTFKIKKLPAPGPKIRGFLMRFLISEAGCRPNKVRINLW